MVSGAALQSYGVHVAQLAGFPKEVIQRASQLLEQRESHSALNKRMLLPNHSEEKEKDSILIFLCRRLNPTLYRKKHLWIPSMWLLNGNGKLQGSLNKDIMIM